MYIYINIRLLSSCDAMHTSLCLRLWVGVWVGRGWVGGAWVGMCHTRRTVRVRGSVFRCVCMCVCVRARVVCV